LPSFDDLSLFKYLLQFDYAFYFWTLLVTSLVSYVAYSKYTSYKRHQTNQQTQQSQQQSKQKAFISTRHQAPSQSQQTQTKSLNNTNQYQPLITLKNLIIGILICLKDLFVYILHQLYQFIVHKLTKPNSNNNSSSYPFNWSTMSSNSSSNETWFNNCIKWFFLNNETVKKTYSTILNSLNSNCSSMLNNNNQTVGTNSVRFDFLLLLLCSFEC
jgi:hypothetical protein